MMAKTLLLLRNQQYEKLFLILNNSSCCIDLTLTTELNLEMKSGVHSFLHEYRHHQLP